MQEMHWNKANKKLAPRGSIKGKAGNTIDPLLKERAPKAASL